MPQKGPPEMPPPIKENVTREQKKPSHEIDEIFSNKKRKKPEKEQVGKQKEEANTESKKMKIKKKRKVIFLNNQERKRWMGLPSTLKKGWESRSRMPELGVNAILAISLALCKAGVGVNKIPLYKHIANLAGNKSLVLPIPALYVINGGSHAGNKLAMREFMILPIGPSSFKEAMKMGVEV